MGRVAILAVLLACASCMPREQSKTAAAYETPLEADADRGELLDLVRREADVEGMHVDPHDAASFRSLSSRPPELRKTFDAAVWRDAEAHGLVAAASDGPDHPGRVWILFIRDPGADPAPGERFRARLMTAVVARWPETRSLPIMPSGAVPLPRDLRRMAAGYRVEPSAASRYGLDVSSPLVAAR